MNSSKLQKMRPPYKTNCHLLLFLFSTLFSSGLAQTFEQGEAINGPGFGYGGIKTFDADRDGDLDILSFPYVYFNDGHGKTQKMIAIGETKKEYEHYALEDMDGDKDMDLVVLYKDGIIDILLNSSKGFSSKKQAKKVYYMPAEYAKLYLYDANSDGIRDIIISGLRGVPVAYIGTSDQQYTYFKPFNDQFRKMNHVLGLDINKDGIQELLVLNYPAIQGEKPALTAYAFKAGKYEAVNTIALTTGGMNNNIKLADIDKDGDQDLVYSYGYPAGGIYWIERNSKGGLAATHTLADQLKVEDFQLGDFDTDGDLDFAYFIRDGQYTNINWAKNSGKYVYVKDSPSLLPNIKESKAFIFEDFNGDKIKDVLFYYDDNERIRPRYTMALQQKDGKLKELNTWIMNSRCAGFIFTDLDSNGTKDIAGYFNNELFSIFIDRDGKYSEAQELGLSPFKINALKCSDIDNDGMEDLVISSDDGDNGKLGWFKNDGGKKLTQFTLIHDEKERLINFEILDYDNDGNKDVAVNYWKNDIRGIYTYQNNGKGLFSKTRTTVNEIKTLYPRFAIWDMDSDGIEDIVDKEASWFKYTGNGKFEKQENPLQGRFIESISKAEFNRDGKADCLVLSSSDLKWFEYNKEALWQGKVIPNNNFGIEKVSVGDMNGDSFDDIICLANKYDLAPGFHDDIAFSYQYSIIQLENDQSGNFITKTLFPVANLTGIAIHDIDGDGDLDIITSGNYWPSSGIMVWKNLGKK
jgi:hypothetical protein